MSKQTRQAYIDASIEDVWELVGNPRRHPEWWPRVVEVAGERFAEGDLYAQVSRSPQGTVRTDFKIEHLEDLREIQMRCQVTGMYSRWLLTEAQGGTFVDVELGMDPKTLGTRLFDGVLGRRYFRGWIEQSIDGLKRAVTVRESAPSRLPRPLRPRPPESRRPPGRWTEP